MSHFYNLPFFIAFWVPDVSKPPLDYLAGANRWAASDSRKRCPSLDQRTLSRHNFKASFTALNYTVIRVLVNTDKGCGVIIANMAATLGTHMTFPPLFPLFPPVISLQIACTPHNRQDDDTRKAISMCCKDVWCENLACVSDVIWGQEAFQLHAAAAQKKKTRRKVRFPAWAPGLPRWSRQFRIRSVSMPHDTIWYSTFSCGVEGIQKRSNNVKREVAKTRPWSPTSAVGLQWPRLPESYFPATWGLVRHRTLAVGVGQLPATRTTWLALSEDPI